MPFFANISGKQKLIDIKHIAFLKIYKIIIQGYAGPI